MLAMLIATFVPDGPLVIAIAPALYSLASDCWSGKLLFLFKQTMADTTGSRIRQSHKTASLLKKSTSGSRRATPDTSWGEHSLSEANFGHEMP
jgi:hypothetical protein